MAKNKRAKIHEKLEVVKKGYANGVATNFPLTDKEKEKMIDKAIRSRLEDGQLDECPLTMADLQKIKGRRDGKHGLIPVLSGLYHSRPEYPSKDD